MSTDYKLACKKHKVFIGVSSRGFSGFQMQIGDPCLFAEFIYDHQECDLFVLSEHQQDSPEFIDYKDLDDDE